VADILQSAVMPEGRRPLNHDRSEFCRLVKRKALIRLDLWTSWSFVSRPKSISYRDDDDDWAQILNSVSSCRWQSSVSLRTSLCSRLHCSHQW